MESVLRTESDPKINDAPISVAEMERSSVAVRDASGLQSREQNGTTDETTDSGAPRIWPWTRLFLWLIHGYQRAMEGRPSPCRFTPSCSTYATESLRTHGLIKGSGLAIWRILRCNPWGGQGFDPVPPRHRLRSSGSVRECSHKHNNHRKAN